MLPLPFSQGTCKMQSPSYPPPIAVDAADAACDSLRNAIGRIDEATERARLFIDKIVGAAPTPPAGTTAANPRENTVFNNLQDLVYSIDHLHDQLNRLREAKL